MIRRTMKWYLLATVPLILAACGGGNQTDASAAQSTGTSEQLLHSARAIPSRTTSPSTVVATPARFAINVATDVPIRLTFAQPIITTSVGPDTVYVTGPHGRVEGDFEFGPQSCAMVRACEEDSAFIGVREVMFRPTQALEAGAQYTIEATGVRAAISYELVPALSSIFTTKASHAQASRISVGGGNTCSVVADESGKDRVKCWGINSSGQLGLNDSADRGSASGQMGADLPFVKLPLDAQDQRDVVQVAVGDGHSCALLEDGQLMCWGNNQYGQLGRGDGVTPLGVSWNPMSMVKPVALALQSGDRVASVAAGGFSTCALSEAGHVYCWGRNEQGELGLGDTQHHGDEPNDIGQVNLGVGRHAVKLTMGQWHRCALLDDGALKCWGRNNLGQLGLGDKLNRGALASDMGDNLPALDFGKNRRAVMVEAGGEHTCAVLDNGKLVCWGSNAGGRLGLGTFSSDVGSAVYAVGDQPGEMGEPLPSIALRAGNGPIASLSAGFNHTCASFANGTLQCWGLNYNGQLGLGDTAARGDQVTEMGAQLPMVNLGLGQGQVVVAVSAGGSFGCARLNDSSLKCWGDNTHGQLGLGHAQNQGDEAGEMATLESVKLH
jgi:alpha-tubulin suppressor-like RCC1 family protein